MTILVIRASHAIQSAGWTLLIGPLVALAFVWGGGRLFLDAGSRAQLLAQVPLYGPLVRWASLAEFCHYLALLIECEVPLATSVVLAADGARDAGLVRACRAIAGELQAGHTLAESVAWWERIFPRGFRKMLGWAEGHQSLPETLHMTAEMFEARARSHAAFIGSVCGTVFIIIILWACAFLVVALYWPIISLISKLS
jgi:type II secretory pathway component PulF